MSGFAPLSQNDRVRTVTYDTVGTTAFGELRTAQITPVCGWTFAYNIIDEMVQSTLSGSGAISQDAGRCKLESGAAINSSAKVLTRRNLQYTPGVGGLVRFTCVFGTPKVGNTQIIGIVNGADGLYFGYNGTEFGVCRKRDGVENWITQANRNSNTCPWFNPQLGNVFQINFQWLGAGAIRFYIEDVNTGKYTLVHTILYAGTSADVSIMNPSLPIEMFNVNTTNNTNVAMYSSSAMAFQEHRGLGDSLDNPLSVHRILHIAKASVTTEAPVLLLKNDTALNGKTNRLNMDFEMCNLLSDGTKTAHFRFVRNPTLSGTAPVFSNVLLNQSPVLYDATLTGVVYSAGTGIEKFQASLSKVDRLTESLQGIGLRLLPGETLLVLASSANSTDVEVSLAWNVTF